MLLPHLGVSSLTNDPYFNNVSLLLSARDGLIKDYSKTPKTISVFGNTTISSSQAKWGNKSIYFDGNGDYLSTPYITELNILSGDFTIEFWVYPLILSGVQPIICQWKQDVNVGGFIVWLEGNKIGFVFEAISSTSSFMSGGNLSINTWYFIQVIRNASNFYIYINNSLVSSYISSATKAAINIPISLGDYFNVSGIIGTTNPDLFAHIEDMRITKGVARSIAVPTQPFPNW